MKTKVIIQSDSDTAKAVKEVVKKMAENQEAFRQQVQSGQAMPKPKPHVRTV
jgi:hypothetical protein